MPYDPSRFMPQRMPRKVIDGSLHYLCPDCPFHTRYTSVIVKHVRTHSGEKPFKCMYCNFRASQKYSVLRHESRHISANPRGKDLLGKCPSDLREEAYLESQRMMAEAATEPDMLLRWQLGVAHASTIPLSFTFGGPAESPVDFSVPVTVDAINPVSGCDGAQSGCADGENLSDNGLIASASANVAVPTVAVPEPVPLLPAKRPPPSEVRLFVNGKDVMPLPVWVTQTSRSFIMSHFLTSRELEVARVGCGGNDDLLDFEGTRTSLSFKLSTRKCQ